MNERDEGADKASLPAQQAQQPQPAQGAQNEGWAARAGSLSGDFLDGSKLKAERAMDGRSAGVEDARFTAGVVSFYEAVLKEPIPEKMLRLIKEIAKQEQKS